MMSLRVEVSPSPSIFDKLAQESLPRRQSLPPYHCGLAAAAIEPSGLFGASLEAQSQSVERRSSGAPSDFAGSDLASDFTEPRVLTGSILALSTCGVSTRVATSACDASAERSGARSERGRATER